MSARPVSARELLSFGIVAGAAWGVMGGLVEAVLPPHGTWLRVPYVIGADGLVGAAWGLIAALPFLVLRSGGRARTLGRCFALVTFPFLAAALGITVNRVLLSGTHFLSPVSLAADAAAVLAAGFLAVLAGRRVPEGFRPGVAALVLPAAFAGTSATSSPPVTRERSSATAPAPKASS